jgi:hypothetical protein
MQKERLWFGVGAIVMPILLLLLILTPGVHRDRVGPVKGRVSIHGRPMMGGFIVFVPDDAKANSAIGQIDDTGHYVIRSRWDEMDAPGGTHFRICLFPKLRPSSIADGFPRRLIDPATSRLEVRLDSGSAEVNIAL